MERGTCEGPLFFHLHHQYKSYVTFCESCLLTDDLFLFFVGQGGDCIEYNGKTSKNEV